VKKLVLLLVLAVCIGLASTQVTVFVVKPFGFVSNGKTVLIPRGESMGLLESAESYCADEGGPSNYLCQGKILSEVASDADVLARFPYSSILYSFSNGWQGVSK